MLKKEYLLETLFSGLIPSKTRIRLLVRFFFNPKSRSYLRELAKEFRVSTNSVRKELNQLTRTNLLKCERNGRHVFYMANDEHPLFPELRSMVGKVMGIDQVIDGIVSELGDLHVAYLIGDYAEGKDTGIIDLVLVGEVDKNHLNYLIERTEQYVKRKIRPLVLSHQEYEKLSPRLGAGAKVLVWEADKGGK
ncbi:MAG: winged helix-turn-helix domain-containing protein [Thermodesulfobacteriota bacterium]|nr:winged helix-turn-helix domain-containing protein [Thermodesulfobacteriota bacterium]